MDLGARRGRERRMHHDGSLRGEEAGIGLVDGDIIGGQAISGKAPRDVGAGENLVRQRVLPARPQGTVDDPAVRTTGVEPARDEQQLFLGEPLGLAPQLVSAAEKRDVAWMFEIGEPDDPVEPVRRTHHVPEIEPLEPEDALSSAGQLPQGSRAHGADADDDCIEMLHRLWSKSSSSAIDLTSGAARARATRQSGVIRLPLGAPRRLC